MNPWLPKSIECLRDYSKKKFVADLIAGVTVGLVALPLAMAFAISSGLSPQAGIYCAVVTGFLISALGGSKMQIGGPTGAFVVVVAGIVAKYGVEGLFVCTLMAGLILILLGVTGMGTAVRFIPRPVVVGFTNGIAMLIASTQIKDFFGLKIESVPSEFIARMEAIGANFHTISLEATALGAGCVVLILFCTKYVKRVPGYIAALLIGTAVAALMQLPVETIGSKFGGIPSGLPQFHVPRMRFDLILKLLSPALTIAMLGAIESLMSAVVSDRMSGDQHKPNVELIAQGVANIFSPMFGGLPATGAIARTATNIRAGAQTPVAGIVHSITLLAVLIFAAPLAKFVPMPVLAGILFIVAWNMGEWKEIPELLKLSKADISVWFVTFLLTVVADLTLAVEVGMILAALMFIRKVAITTTVTEVTREYIRESRIHILQDKNIPDYVSIFRIHGPFLFGATEKLREISNRVDELPETVVLRLRNMPAIDATGMQALEELADQLHKSGRNLLLCGAREQPVRLMRQAEFAEHVGAENICVSVTDAMERAEQLHRAVTSAR
jgi:SulP family sulfate permease